MTFLHPRFHRLLLTLLTVMLAACGNQQASPLKLGTNVWPGYEPLYLARELGLLDPARVRLVELTSASQVIQALHNGLIDAAAVTLDEALLLAEAGENIGIVLVTDVSNGADVILGRPGIGSLENLAGKRIGFEATALGAYMVVRAAESAGLPLSTLQLANLKVNEHEHAFDAADIDAVVTFEPVASKLLQQGATRLFDSSQIPGEIVDVIVVRRDLLATHGEELDQLVHAWFGALARMQADPAMAWPVLGKRLGLDAGATETAFANLMLPDAASSMELMAGDGPHSLRSVAERLYTVMKDNHLVAGHIDFDGLFDPHVFRRSQP